MKRLLFCVSLTLLSFGLIAQAVPVQVLQTSPGVWQLRRGGQPYFIKGAAGGGFGNWYKLKNYGGNSMRFYGINNNTLAQLDSAQANGATMMLGISLPGQNGFDYSNATAVANQLQTIKTLINTYKNHPAVLCWAIGNEIINTGSADPILNAMNAISQMIHTEDPNHPTCIVTAGITTALANIISTKITDIDFLGVNYYGAILSINPQISASTFTKPYVITEWGTNGPWEVGLTAWGDPIEASSTAKATQFKNRYAQAITAFPNRCLGSYAFLWGDKPEGSPVWFSLIFRNEDLEPIDELSLAWMGRYPTNRAPTLSNSRLNGITVTGSARITKPDSNYFSQTVSDPNGDKLLVEYLLRPASGEAGTTTSPYASLPFIPNVIYNETDSTCRLRFADIHSNKAYKLFIFIRDGKGRMATQVMPLYVDSIKAPFIQLSGNSSKGRVFPSPAKDMITFEVPDNIFKQGNYVLQIRDASGKLNFSNEYVNGRQYTASVASLPAGIYFVTAVGKNKKEEWKTKFMKQ
jgi:hypothetical protein